jgi:hypothetical protein
MLAMAALALAAGSCTNWNTVPDSEGWAQGYVRKVVRGSEIKDIEVRPCVARLPREQAASLEFVVVTYRQGRAWGYRTVALPDAFAPTPGQRVWVNIRNCSEPLRPSGDGGSAG